MVPAEKSLEAKLAKDAQWMQKRAHLKWLFELFPPNCAVRGTVPLGTPAPGEIGYICRYHDDGQLEVNVPDNPVIGMCNPEDLQVVSYGEGETPEWVRSVFEPKN